MDHLFFIAAPSSFLLKEAEAIELAGVRTTGRLDAKGNSILAAYTTRIRPDGKVSAEARNEGNYEESGWTNAPSFVEAIAEIKSNLIAPFSHHYVVVAYRAEFVRPMLRNQCEKAGMTEEVFPGRSWLDIGQLAWPLSYAEQLETRTIRALADHFGIKIRSESDAADVCTAMVNVYGAMMRRYHTALTGEKAVRELGGETLQGLRRIIGF